MMMGEVACARCAHGNHPSSRFCDACGLPLGAVQSDAAAAADVLGPLEPPSPGEVDASPAIRDFVERSGYEVSPYGPGWRVLVLLPLNRQQAVYVGSAGRDPERRVIVQVVSVCGAATHRDNRTLLKLNARSVEGHFAIRVLRGEEYFVVVHLLPVEALAHADAAGVLRRIAERGDSLEDRLSRGLDVF